MEKICHRLAVAIFNNTNDPIAPFIAHNNALLDSALHNPQATFGGKELYPTLIDKAAILYYTLNKNHPFDNGNKRISAASLLVFLYLNGYWVTASVNEIVEKTLKIAESSPKEREQILHDTKKWLERVIIEVKE